MAFVPMDLPGGSRSTTLPAPERHICCLFPFLRRPPVRGRNDRTSISSVQYPCGRKGIDEWWGGGAGPPAVLSLFLSLCQFRSFETEVGLRFIYS